MKRCKARKTFGVVVCLLLTLIFCENYFKVEAHELWSPTYNFKWVHYNSASGRYYMRASLDWLSSSCIYYDNIETVLDCASSSATRTFCYVDSSSPTLYFQVPTKQIWNAYGYSRYAAAYTRLVDTASNSVASKADAISSNQRINQAIILFNPNEDVSNESNLPNQLRNVLIMHEIGHAYGLGHSDSYAPYITDPSASILYSAPPTYVTPDWKTHDIQDFQGKYF